jgi:hypothetical protein
VSEEDQIRRLLADARHTDPIPPDVADRMDGVIADLGADHPVRATVTDLAAARRRRRLRTLLVAAAAVAVVGIGVDQLRGADLSRSDDSASSADSADSAGGRAEASGDAGAEQPRPQELDEAVPIASDRFARQIAQLQRGATETTTEEARKDADRYTRLQGERCRLPDLGDGRAVVVQYDGGPGVVVFRPLSGATQVADLFLCGREDVVRSVTLPAT